MHAITANDLKINGISKACVDDETLVMLRGKPAYVVVKVDKYEALQAAELSLALAEAKRDYELGNYSVQSVADHIKEISK